MPANLVITAARMLVRSRGSAMLTTVARNLANSPHAGRAAGFGTTLRDGVNASLGSFRDPAAKFRRRLQRAKLALEIRAVLTFVVAAVTAYEFAGGSHLVAVFIGIIGLALLVSTVGSGRLVWQMKHTPLPQPPPPLPPAGSAARSPMELLAARERSLGELLMLLGPAAGDTASEASLAAAVLRDRAARITAMETARRDAPAPGADELTGAIQAASAELSHGVRAYDRLVLAAASAVSAANGDARSAMADVRLRDAADQLTGLASGLREVGSRTR